MNEVALKNTAAEKKKRELGAADIVFLVLCVLPIIAMIVLKVLFTPQTDGVNIAGALIYFTVPMPFGTISDNGIAGQLMACYSVDILAV